LAFASDCLPIFLAVLTALTVAVLVQTDKNCILKEQVVGGFNIIDLVSRIYATEAYAVQESISKSYKYLKFMENS